MLVGILLAVVSGGLFLKATPRAEGRLRGARATALGLVVLLLAIAHVHVAGLGLAVSTALVLGVIMLALPCLSGWRALRRRAQHRAVAR